MLRSVCKLILQNRVVYSKLICICHFPARRFFNSGSKSPDQQSLTVSYLVNSCGLSLQQALSASKKVNIEDTNKRPDSVLELFATYGFAKSQVSRLICIRPHLILADSDLTLRPKIEYFQSLGIVGPDLPKFIISNHSLLFTSLHNRIIPNCDFLKGILETNENLVRSLKQTPCVAGGNIEKTMKPNINTLRAIGVLTSHIVKLLILQPQAFMLRDDLFKEVVLEALEMGFRPKSRSFSLAVRSLSRSKVNWDKKSEVLKSFGWSQDEVLAAFRVQPMLMVCSEKKIGKVMDFLVNKVGLKPSDVARCPNLLLTSLERRIIPRCTLLEILAANDVFKKGRDIVWALNSTKEMFEKKFVTQYEYRVPEAIKAYWSEVESLKSTI
ncbi:hypothetical protein FNV43_RR22293 [Rhamnella rubrinervis]|uniref:Uncharacterized protein n=1 Tax=Rhamnella rubrinervis TaxID=2594499 RepID=A0A8K0GRX9_9ROSA|nr:hypothetical protein FNV43_RR22293 [Rhamnella rubrinervis]